METDVRAPATPQCSTCGANLPRARGRGLCHRCYYRAEVEGRLDDFPRVTRPSADTVEELEFLPPMTTRQAARELGYHTPQALYRALHRAGRTDLWGRMRAAEAA